MGWRTYVPLDEQGSPNPRRQTVELWQHTPGTTDELADATGGQRITVNGAAAILLPGKGGVVGLGDFARLSGGRYAVEYADGLATRYTPADQHDDQEA